jgi:hypothetical protein
VGDLAVYPVRTPLPVVSMPSIAPCKKPAHVAEWEALEHAMRLDGMLLDLDGVQDTAYGRFMTGSSCRCGCCGGV